MSSTDRICAARATDAGGAGGDRRARARPPSSRTCGSATSAARPSCRTCCAASRSCRPRSARRPARRPTRPARRSRQAIESARRSARGAELDARLVDDRIDVTLPADPAPQIGRLHLITQTWREIEDVFIGLGFNVAEGPEVETVYYNFDALNHASTHPSRLMTDTFYVEPADDIFDPETLAAARPHLAGPGAGDGTAAAADLHHRPRAGSTGSTPTPPTRRSFTRSRGWRSTTTSRSPTCRARC